MSRLAEWLPAGRPVLVLAPMQDVTDLPFWKVTARYGAADLYYTEYFRVHRDSHPEAHIVRSIRENPTGRPVIAQMIGEDLPSLVRTAKLLEKLPVAGIDLNMGCPAPVVCRKSAGGGLLKRLDHIDLLAGALRSEIGTAFTIKTRIGFDDPAEFDGVLEVLSRHRIDALTVHGRTVREMYRSHVHYDRIAEAVRRMPCPVFANGNIISPGLARQVSAETGAAGLMIGRGAIRSPWLFGQVRDVFAGRVPRPVPLAEVRAYVEELFHGTWEEGFREVHHVAKMKKYMNFIAQGVNGSDQFLHEIRRAVDAREFFGICDRHLLGGGELEMEPATRNLVNSGNPRQDCYG